MTYEEALSWIYQARRIAQQTNAAGGAITIDIAANAGQIIRLLALKALNSGNNGLYVNVYDEDNALANKYAIIGAAAATTCHLPAIGTDASTSNNNASSIDLILAPGEKLSIVQSGAGVQNDTLTVAVKMELFNVRTSPTWDKSRSTNQADVTLAASTISTANTTMIGRVWRP